MYSYDYIYYILFCLNKNNIIDIGSVYNVKSKKTRIIELQL